jgi:hypothetical protein
MDVSEASYCIHKNNKNKGRLMWHTKKIFLKTSKNDQIRTELEIYGFILNESVKTIDQFSF